MCGRFSITRSAEVLQEIFGRTFSPNQYGIEIETKLPNYNVSPNTVLPILLSTDTKHFLKGRWGLSATNYYQQSSIINARIETLLQKATFKRLVCRQRCLVPADGYYEWKTIGKQKIPYRITLPDNNMFCMAGLFDLFQLPNGNLLPTFCIITRPATQSLAPIHHRMPLCFSIDWADQWLYEHPIPGKSMPDINYYRNKSLENFTFYTISDRINNPKNNSAEVVLPITKQVSEQGKLF